MPELDAAEENAPFRFDIFTIFPGIFSGPLDESILRRAQDRGIASVGVHDIRGWAADKHRTVDDTVYGGGAGMLMKAPPIVAAVEEVLGDALGQTRILVMSAGGRLFDQALADELATGARVAIVCGRYEGIDDRAVQLLGAEEISIGDYVLTGGELAAAVVIDAVTRLLPGAIDAASTSDESHRGCLLEYPQYTRPQMFRGLEAPAVLLSGHHAEIARWRREQAILRTARLRPDLIDVDNLTPAERLLVERDDS